MAKSKAKEVQKETKIDEQLSRLRSILVLQRENDIISMLLEGKETKEIANYICPKYRITPASAGTYIKDARNLIKERKSYEVDILISLHIHRYEKIYQLLYELGAYSIAMNALRAKEKLLSFHKEGFHMRITNGEMSTVSLQTVDSEYDLMKLTQDKRERMSVLLQKAKREKGDKALQMHEVREKKTWTRQKS